MKKQELLDSIRMAKNEIKEWTEFLCNCEHFLDELNLNNILPEREDTFDDFYNEISGKVRDKSTNPELLK